MKKAEVDSGNRAGVQTEVADMVKALEREVRELRQADEILRYRAFAEHDIVSRMTDQPTSPEPESPVDDMIADSAFKPTVSKIEHAFAATGFHLVERILLILVALMTVAGAIAEIVTIYQMRTISLADILQMFLYTEVIGMVSVFYTGKGPTFIYPIFIAMTALARLIVLQSKDMAPQNIVFEASAILLLALAAVVIARVSRPADSGGR